ncbi:MAG: GspMb/PilO family protein [Candidatus Acidiferrales bacterium]
MKNAWKTWKLYITIALLALLVVDLALLAAYVRISSQSPQALQAQLVSLRAKSRLLKADVDRGQRIRSTLSQAGSECTKFYNSAFLDASTGYSGVSADLNSIAKEAGLQTGSVDFKQKAVERRGVSEIAITETVDGTYPALIRFINGLERSKNFYMLRSLTLTSASTGGIQLKLELATYFRT